MLLINVIFTLSLVIHLLRELSGPVKPQPVVPMAMLYSGDLPVPGGGVEANMPQVLMQ